MHRSIPVFAVLAIAACSSPSAQPDAAAPTADGSNADAVPVECMTVAPTECESPAPVFADIVPILEDRCLQCHNGVEEDGPWPLDTYEHVAAWHAEIRAAMLACTMPPPEENVPITTEERQRILMWIRCGFLEN